MNAMLNNNSFWFVVLMLMKDRLKLNLRLHSIVAESAVIIKKSSFEFNNFYRLKIAGAAAQDLASLLLGSFTQTTFH